MVKNSYGGSEYDQFDPKVYRETIGSFGTTTKPGGNQLVELQTKIRQGVKHVELHLGGTSKGQFGALDVPDKYGFEQRRTIMQLAKLNNQTLSVHGTFNVVDFTGLSESGGTYQDSTRYNNLKEIDETIKFAAETAKGGAVVFHIQGVGGSQDRSELNLPKSYLEWLKKNKPDEYNYLSKNYLKEESLDRLFVSNIAKDYEVKEEFLKLKEKNPQEFEKYVKEFNGDINKAYKKYYEDKNLLEKRLSPDTNPLVVLGNKISATKREEEIIDFSKFNKKENFPLLEKLGLFKNKKLSLEDVQKLNFYLISDYSSLPNNIKNNISETEFNKLKDEYLITYDKVLKENNFLSSEADAEFHKKLLDYQIELANLKEKDLDEMYELYKDDLKQLEKLKEEQEKRLEKLKELSSKDDLTSKAMKEQLKRDLESINNQILQISQSKIGMENYGELSKYNEVKLNLEKQKKQLEDQKKDVVSFVDKLYEKNVSAMAHLGIKALQQQLDLKIKSKTSKDKIKENDTKINLYYKKLKEAKSQEEVRKINEEISKLEYKKNKFIGLSDYVDIDLINNPLYLAPENMLPGYGPLTSIEEYKAVLRMSQQEFAKRILSDEPTYKKIREEYEKETGIKIDSKEKALELAKRHLAGTFDTAHAGVWIKHFKPLEGESEENRIDRFNKWLIEQAEDMVKEGLVKHIHFNDTAGKDDDHSLIGDGILDMHEMRKRLREAGVKEAFIVEAGGRGAATSLQILNALNIFNPSLGYGDSTTVSDWVSVRRNYENIPKYNQYGLGDSTFRPNPPEGVPKGSWSGQGFL
jgi:hypothetical protein